MLCNSAPGAVGSLFSLSPYSHIFMQMRFEHFDEMPYYENKDRRTAEDNCAMNNSSTSKENFVKV